MKNYLFGTISFLLAICFIILCGEMAARLYLRDGRSMQFDNELGWLPSSNYISNGDKTDAKGKSYPVCIKTNADGFRIFGDTLNKNKKRVLFLGDSYTHAMHVSNNKTFYGILKNTMPLEIFAFGGSGYGTLQEYMILEKYIDDIKPDIIVMQFCSNDFINNSYDLEVRSIRNNNGFRRPYLTENGIVYKNPKRFSMIRDFVNKHSLFLYFIVNRIDRLTPPRSGSVEDTITQKGLSYSFYKESVEITDQLIKKIKMRIPSSTKLYAFSTDDIDPYFNEFIRISEANNIGFIDGIPQALREAEQNGITTRVADKKHWNETSHQIAASIIQQYFEVNLY